MFCLQSTNKVINYIVKQVSSQPGIRFYLFMQWMHCKMYHFDIFSQYTVKALANCFEFLIIYVFFIILHKLKYVGAESSSSELVLRYVALCGDTLKTYLIFCVGISSIFGFFWFFFNVGNQIHQLFYSITVNVCWSNVLEDSCELKCWPC